MQLQLRTYTINKGCLELWVQEWETMLVPLREKLGFVVLEAYSLPSSNQFVWLMGYAGSNTWEAADQAYFDSEERKTMQPDPGRFIARMENVFVQKVR